MRESLTGRSSYDYIYSRVFLMEFLNVNTAYICSIDIRTLMILLISISNIFIKFNGKSYFKISSYFASFRHSSYIHNQIDNYHIILHLFLSFFVLLSCVTFHLVCCPNTFCPTLHLHHMLNHYP